MSEDAQEDANDVSGCYDPLGTYMEAQQCFHNTHQQGAAELSGKVAKWFWDRQATLMNHKVTYDERMAQKQLGGIGMQVGARISTQEQRKEDRKKRKQVKREEGQQRNNKYQ